MKALFIGGTGTISSAITRLVSETPGWELYLLNRGSRKHEVPKNVKTITADINDEAQVVKALEGMTFDVVCDFIGFVPEQVERDYRLFKGRVKQYIYISSASAYHKPLASPIINEGTTLANPFWQYSRDKIACEEVLMRRYRNEGVPITIVRPSHTYSERGVPTAIHGPKGCWSVLKRILNGKPVIIPGDGTTLWTVTHNTDFAKAFVGLMGNKHAIGEAFQITGERFKGVYNLFESSLNLYTPSKQTISESVAIKSLDDPLLDERVGEQDAEKLREDVELLSGVYPDFDKEAYLDGQLAPVFFGSALNNFGVRELLDCFCQIAPSPKPTQTVERMVQPDEDKFSGFVFKIHANMDPNHRSCIAFVKICSGKFERNVYYKHVRLGQKMRFSAPTCFMAQKKEVVDECWPGDIVGLPDSGGTFKIGDTITSGEDLHFRGIPSFSPELFQYIENADPMKAKQLAKGIDQLMDEGVAQVFTNQFNGRKVIGTVGQLQFEVIQYRLEHEYNAKCRWEPIRLYKACWIETDDEEEFKDFKRRKMQFMATDKDGRDVFLAESGYVLQMAQQDFPHIKFHFTSEF